MSLSQRQSIPRAAKNSVNYVSYDTWFPGINSDDPLHVHVTRLNLQAFPSSLVSFADDLIIRALFGSKKSNPRWNDVVPAPSSPEWMLRLPYVQDDIRAASKLCWPLTNGGPVGSLIDFASTLTSQIMSIRTFKKKDVEWCSIIEGCVNVTVYSAGDTRLTSRI